MYAVSVNSFLAPNGIINGGFTGIATILNRLFLLPIGTAVYNRLHLRFFAGIFG